MITVRAWYPQEGFKVIATSEDKSLFMALQKANINPGRFVRRDDLPNGDRAYSFSRIFAGQLEITVSGSGHKDLCQYCGAECVGGSCDNCHLLLNQAKEFCLTSRGREFFRQTLKKTAPPEDTYGRPI